MKDLKLRFVSLIAGMAIFYNLEALAAGLGLRAEELQVQAITKLLVTLAILIILISPRSTRRTASLVVIAATAIYFLRHLNPLSQKISFDGLHLFLTVTELAFLIFLSVLAAWVAGSVAEFRESVAFVTLEGAGGRPQKVAESQPQIQAEMSRSRHFRRPLSVIAVEFDQAGIEKRIDRLVAEAQARLARRYARAKVVNDLRERLRLIDLVMETESEGSFLVLCPEADQETAAVLAGRVCAALEAGSVQTRCATATFPDEGLTFGALVAEAEVRLHHGPVPTTIDPATFETANEVGRL